MAHEQSKDGECVTPGVLWGSLFHLMMGLGSCVSMKVIVLGIQRNAKSNTPLSPSVAVCDDERD